MPPAIRIENLGKRYRVNHAVERMPYRTLRESLVSAVTAPLRRVRAGGHDGTVEDFWALKDISFDVQPGEVVGIIGRNGAGKSTLLKILSRITKPTTGRVTLRGRVGSLLEVGTGFHPELTGRENVYLNGGILGMSRKEIARNFDAIVDFSGVEKFLDTPVKRYSSGMQVRLAFAVAAHLEPEILIVDEVLAVGDAEFQKKCLGKMREVSTGGRTVFFVSHNMQAVSTLTTKCILLRTGRLALCGEPEFVISRYMSEGTDCTRTYTAPGHPTEPRVIEARVHTSGDGGVHRHGEPLQVTFVVDAPRPIDSAGLSFQFTDNYGRAILHLWAFESETPFGRTAGLHTLTCSIPHCRLYLGHYRMVVHLSEGPLGKHFETIHDVCPFEIVMHGMTRDFPWVAGTCTYIEDCRWIVE